MANNPTPNPFAPPATLRFMYDFALCADVEELKACFAYLNSQGCCLRAVTQDGSGVYTVFFERFAHG